MKRFSVMLLGLALAFGVQADVVYQDSFDNDTLATNTGTGGGLIARKIRQHTWTDNGTLNFLESGNTHYLNRAIAYTENSFQSTGGFELTVSYFNSDYGGASKLAFGLVSDDTDFSTYSGQNPFTVAAHYGFGATTDNGKFTFTDGTATTTLQDGANLTLNADTDVVMRFENNGTGGADWSWSVGGVARNSGTITTFDFSKSFQFVAYGQDDQGVKRINSVVLDAIPEPAALTLVAMTGLGFLYLKRRFS